MSTEKEDNKIEDAQRVVAIEKAGRAIFNTLKKCFPKENFIRY
ncbi:hypothetical protein [Psychrosphaera algicola]|uniref:Uncharacterized protein n=1 Tax=Psychrosphaera algicola TaxID=3023714 RepID=A0ABT5FA96_9GAMM|nr:hypothetical protein [Psychrosphaera sp. G1-22]MDC2887979.1 hypothetical protein [Psychrosphaera sp. G1-22]